MEVVRFLTLPYNHALQCSIPIKESNIFHLRSIDTRSFVSYPPPQPLVILVPSYKQYMDKSLRTKPMWLLWSKIPRQSIQSFLSRLVRIPIPWRKERRLKSADIMAADLSPHHHFNNKSSHRVNGCPKHVMNNYIPEICPGIDIIRDATLVGRHDLDAMLCQGRGTSARIVLEENGNAAEMYVRRVLSRPIIFN
jgi:hypothetical protein